MNIDEISDKDGVKALYLRWLLEQIDAKKAKKYTSLMLHLFREPFAESAKVPRDVNRCKDGIALRKYFINDRPGMGDQQLEAIKYEDCSWLEMLVALSRKIDDQMMFDMNLGNRTPQWFWLIIEQMDLNIYDEKHYIYIEVKEKLRDFELRNYKNNGKNGIFKCLKDVTKVEIWYQMMEFFNETGADIEW